MVDFLYWLMEHPLVVFAGIFAIITLLVLVVVFVRRGRAAKCEIPVIPAPRYDGPDLDAPKLAFATDDDRLEYAATASITERSEGAVIGGAKLPPLPTTPVGLTPSASPAAASAASASTPVEEPRYRLRSQMLKSAFTGKIPKVKVSTGYRIGMMLVAGILVILPLVYLAIVAMFGYVVYYHATVNRAAIFAEGVDRLTLFIFLAPLTIGGIVLIFLVKPLLAPRARYMEPHVIDPAKEPLLVCFVEEVCKAVGAPIPREIAVDCEVNASAGLRHGLWSLFSSNDLRLTLGMALIAGLNLRQLAGLLAHEFGHFKQGSAVAMNYITFRINAWFARVVYQRDAWDEMLSQMCSGGHPAIMVIFWITGIFVAITRGILWCLMMIAHLLSCYLMRQQEYDADRYGAHVAGSKAYNSMLLQLPLLSVGAHEAYKNLSASFRKFVLAPDFASLAHARTQFLGEMVQNKVLQQALAEKTSRFDTHPALKERLEAVKALDSEGVFNMDRPATELFTDFKGLSSQITLHHYRIIIGPLVREDTLMPNDQYEERFGMNPANMRSAAGL